MCMSVFFFFLMHINISQKLNILVHFVKGKLCWAMARVQHQNHSGGGSSGGTYGSLLLVCHGSFRPTISGRLLTASLRQFQVRPVHKWHSQTLTIWLMISASSLVCSCVACIVTACSCSPPQCYTFTSHYDANYYAVPRLLFFGLHSV